MMHQEKGTYYIVEVTQPGMVTLTSWQGYGPTEVKARASDIVFVPDSYFDGVEDAA